MTGTGATFIREGQEHGVDPVFLVAIAGAETSFGQFLYSENDDQCTFNAFNWFYGPTWPTSYFSSWDEAIARVAEGLAGSLYDAPVSPRSTRSRPSTAPRAPSSGSPMSSRSWRNSAATPPTHASPPPPASRRSPAPPRRPSSPAWSRSAGRSSSTRATARSASGSTPGSRSPTGGGQPLDLEGIRLAIRGPGGAVRDMVSDAPLTLAAGQALEVTCAWPLDWRAAGTG